MSGEVNDRRFLLVCDNENQAEIFTLLADELQRLGKQVHLLSLDSYYGRGASAVLARGRHSWSELPSSTCKGDWFRQPKLQARFVSEAVLQIDELISDMQPQLVAVGQDVESLQQLLFRAAERHAIPTAYVQDSINYASDLLPEDDNHRLFPSNGGADLCCLWSDVFLKELVEKRAVYSELRAIGNPRYDSLSDWPGYQSHSGPYTVLIAAQPIFFEGEIRPFAEISFYDRLLRRVLRRDDVALVKLKLHPQQQMVSLYEEMVEEFGARVELVYEGHSLDLLRESDLLIAYSSTVTIESALMGIPTARLVCLDTPSPEKFERRERAFGEELMSSRFPDDICFGMNSLESFYRYFINPPDGRATESIAAELISLVEKRERPVELGSPEASVLIVSSDESPLAAVRSVLRESEFPIEVVVVDVSPDGQQAALLQEQLSDDRLRVFSFPEEGLIGGYFRGLKECRADRILRLGSRAIALPGWAKRLSSELDKNPEAVVAFSGYHLRDKIGVAQSIRTLQPGCSYSELCEKEQDSQYLLSYGSRREALLAQEEDSAGEIQSEADILARVIGDLQDPRRQSVIRFSLFFSHEVLPQHL